MREERRFVATTAPLRSRLGSKLAPDRPSELTFLAVDTRTPYVADFDGADANKVAHYMLRWVSTSGAKGPPALDGPPRTKSAVAQRRGLAACQAWSETASATIGA